MKIKIFDDRIDNKKVLEDEINDLLIENNAIEITETVYDRIVLGNATHKYISICVLYEPK